LVGPWSGPRLGILGYGPPRLGPLGLGPLEGTALCSALGTMVVRVGATGLS